MIHICTGVLVKQQRLTPTCIDCSEGSMVAHAIRRRVGIANEDMMLQISGYGHSSSKVDDAWCRQSDALLDGPL